METASVRVSEAPVRSRWRIAIWLIVVVIVVVAARTLDVAPMLHRTLASFAALGAWGPVLFVLLYVAVTVFDNRGFDPKDPYNSRTPNSTPVDAAIRAVHTGPFLPACWSLPPLPAMPVDIELTDYPAGAEYAVAIYAGESRAQAHTNTAPYLDELVGSGLLRKKLYFAGTTITTRGRRVEFIKPAEVYTVAPEHRALFDSRRRECFMLDPPRLRIVSARAYRSVLGRPRFSYRARLDYDNSAQRAHAAPLAALWPDLQTAIEAGRACAGDFAIDLRTGEYSGGSGSCWWAFDSRFEN